MWLVANRGRSQAGRSPREACETVCHFNISKSSAFGAIQVIKSPKRSVSDKKVCVTFWYSCHAPLSHGQLGVPTWDPPPQSFEKYEISTKKIEKSKSDFEKKCLLYNHSNKIIWVIAPVINNHLVINFLDQFLSFLSPSIDLGIGLVWDNNPTGPQLFGPTVEILFKLN